MRRPGLTYPGYLRGDETLVLGRMHPDFEQVRVQLPSLHLFATVRWRDGWLEQAALVLDGVHVDFFSHLAKAHLTWRCWVPRREGVKVMELRLEDPKELAEDIARHRDAPRVRGYAPMGERGGHVFGRRAVDQEASMNRPSRPPGLPASSAPLP